VQKKLGLLAAFVVAFAPAVAASPQADPGFVQQWPLARAVPSALVADPSVVVAVLDTGITRHPDLGGRTMGQPGGIVLPGYDFISDPWSAGDGDGWDADPRDMGDGVRPAESTDQCKARVSSWHGTNVAGTIAAIGSNGKGITGIASGARILPVRILGRCGGNTADVAAAILWAAGEPVPGVPVNEYPARIINVSLSGSSPQCPRALQTAIDVAEARGAVVVAAAGSSGVDTSNQTPANCRNLVVVGATDRKDLRSPTSNFGKEVTVSAPGGNMAVRETDGIYTTTNSGRYAPRLPRYGYYQGSSAAAAHASGALAVLVSRRPEFTPTELRSSIVRPEVLNLFRAGQCDAGNGRCGAAILRIEKVLQVFPVRSVPD